MTQQITPTTTATTTAPSIIPPVEDLLHYKQMMLKHHKVEIKEDKEGVLVINITPCNDDFFDTTSILHDVNDHVIRVASVRKVLRV